MLQGLLTQSLLVQVVQQVQTVPQAGLGVIRFLVLLLQMVVAVAVEITLLVKAAVLVVAQEQLPQVRFPVVLQHKVIAMGLPVMEMQVVVPLFLLGLILQVVGVVLVRLETPQQ